MRVVFGAGPRAGPVKARQAALGRAVFAVAASILAVPALADDLRQALLLTYETNPTLQAARANQRATDEGVPIAKAAGRPSISGSASYIEFVKKSANSFTAPDRSLDAGIDLGVPIYSGGAVRNSVRGAQTRVVAGQADLRGVESALFSQAVAAYMDVILGQAVVGLNRNNVRVLDVNVQATSDRFEIGDLTRTDVAQSQSRLALAQGDLRSSESNLIGARERYIRVVGKVPQNLQPPPPLPGLPSSPDDAVQIALGGNPDLIAAKERSRAAGYDVRVAGSGRLPRVSLFTGGDYTDYLGTLGGGTIPAGTFVQRQTTALAGVRASIPIFQGGLPAAQRRQAQAREGASLEDQIAVERDVIAQVRAAYASWQAATEIIASTQTAVDAASLGLEGVRAENSVGTRTILDILNAEQELVSARVRLATARRNAYVAGFSLLAAMGKAESRDLGLEGGTFYDPQVNYRRVRNAWWDWSNDPAPIAKSTRTVDTPAQDGSIPPQ